MQNSDPGGRNFLSVSSTHVLFFFFFAYLSIFECFILKIAFIITRNDVDVGRFLK